MTWVITEANQQKIVEAGGLTSLLMLLRTYEDETIRRIAAGAIANLAMNGNFDFIVVYCSPPKLFCNCFLIVSVFKNEPFTLLI